MIKEHGYVSSHSKRMKESLDELSRWYTGNGKVLVVGVSDMDHFVTDRFDDVYYGIPADFPRPNDGVSRKFVELDLVKGVLPAQKFQVIIFTEVLEHLLQDDKLVIYRIWSIMENGGVLCLSVPNALTLSHRLKLLIGKNIWWTKLDIINGVYGGYGHIREYSFSEVKQLLHGRFSLLSMKGINGYRVGLARVLNLLPKDFANTILVIARKINGGV